MSCCSITSCIHRCLSFSGIPACILVYLFQMSIYDYYLIAYADKIYATTYAAISNFNVTTSEGESSFSPWYLMIIPDVFVLALFITAFVYCHKQFNGPSGYNRSPGRGGELPFGYIAWGGYSVLSAVKVGIIFRWIAPILHSDDVLGLNMAKTVVALSCVVFVTLVLNHHDSKPGSPQEALIKFLMHSVTMDLLDTVEMLQVLLYRESGIVLTFLMHKTVVGVACINLILPTVLLIALSKSRFGKDEVWTKRLQAAHKLIQVIFINIPLLVLRVILWQVHRQTISVFVVKNCLALGLMMHSTYSTLVNALKTSTRPANTVTEEVELAGQPMSDTASNIEATGNTKV